MALGEAVGHGKPTTSIALLKAFDDKRMISEVLAGLQAEDDRNGSEGEEQWEGKSGGRWQGDGLKSAGA